MTARLLVQDQVCGDTCTCRVDILLGVFASPAFTPSGKGKLTNDNSGTRQHIGRTERFSGLIRSALARCFELYM